MPKRVFIIHGWGGFPEEAWFPWLQKELQAKGIEAYVPTMPDSETPKINTWVSFLAAQIGQPDADTYLVGHSIGVQTILRYLETIEQPIGGVVAVAGFYNLIPGSLASSLEEDIAKPWLTTPIDNAKVKHNANKITAIFSDNDPYVGLDNVDLFTNNLGAKTIVLHNKGHMGASDNVLELSEVLAEL